MNHNYKKYVRAELKLIKINISNFEIANSSIDIVHKEINLKKICILKHCCRKKTKIYKKNKNFLLKIICTKDIEITTSINIVVKFHKVIIPAVRWKMDKMESVSFVFKFLCIACVHSLKKYINTSMGKKKERGIEIISKF